MRFPLLSRRAFLRSGVAGLAGTFAFSGYAFGVEPLMRLVVTRYRVTPPGWPAGQRLTLCALADIHACEPSMTAERVRGIAAAANALAPDITVLLGDYVRGRRQGWSVPEAQWAAALGTLRAPLGVHAILGNHDWWDDPEAQRRGSGPTLSEIALRDAGIAVYNNDAVRLQKGGLSFWLAGLADQIALLPRVGRRHLVGFDDLEGTLAQVTDDAPVILLAHEPDVFPKVPARVALTLSGHTHGGQVRVLGYSPVVPSRYGNRYAYGHVVENDRHLIVSGGLGCSIVPVRVGVPPEILLVEIGASA